MELAQRIDELWESGELDPEPIACLVPRDRDVAVRLDLDPGPDGKAGTTDDKNITVYNRAPGLTGSVSVRSIVSL